MADNNITEEFQVNISLTPDSSTFQPTDIAYDISINDIPFIAKVSKETPYRRETAQYKKDQVDMALEPGEQSLTGWWLRSQTSWHNGAGIRYFEPGTDAAHVTHRFYNSSGIDVWTAGVAKLHKDVFHAYTGSNGINSCTANDGTQDCLISGDSAGTLRKIIFDGDTNVTGVTGKDILYTVMATGITHNSSYPFYSVTTDGDRYFASCSNAIHRGDINGSDSVIYHVAANGSGVTNAIIQYVKGYLLFGTGRYLAQLNPEKTAITSQHSGSSDLPSGVGDNYINHLSHDWKWNSITGGGNVIYASGRNSSRSEVWAIPYSETTVNLSLPDARVVAEMPFGEYINDISYYLGYLIIATSKGVRIATVDQSGYQAGNITYGPLLFESKYEARAITTNDSYVWISTAVDNESGVKNGVLVRVDMSQPFDDGTYAYAYDLQYLSDDPSECIGVHYLDKKIHLIINEGSSAGEIQREHSTNYRSSGWFETGYIRYATSQPKYFKYIDVSGEVFVGDSITISTIDQRGNEYSIVNLSNASINSTVEIRSPRSKEEVLAFKFTLNNGSPISTTPLLDSYQVKSIPAMSRQRLIQYPLSCYDVEMDRFDSQFGYVGRAWDVIRKLEELENNGNFVQIQDYRTNEKFNGVIEEVRFANESSADKNNNGYGGILLVTVRKM